MLFTYTYQHQHPTSHTPFSKKVRGGRLTVHSPPQSYSSDPHPHRPESRDYPPRQRPRNRLSRCCRGISRLRIRRRRIRWLHRTCRLVDTHSGCREKDMREGALQESLAPWPRFADWELRSRSASLAMARGSWSLYSADIVRVERFVAGDVKIGKVRYLVMGLWSSEILKNCYCSGAYIIEMM